MQKWFFFLIGLIIISANAQNLLKNGDFSQLQENGNPAEWVVKIGDKNREKNWGVEKADNGKNAFYMRDFLMNKGFSLQQNVRVTPGNVYDLKYCLKTDFPQWKTTAAFHLVWTDKNHKPLIQPVSGFPNAWAQKLRKTQGTRDWAEFELTGCIAPAEAVFANIRMYMMEDGNGKCAFSDIRMYETPRGDDFANRIISIPFIDGDISLNDIFNADYRQNSAVMDDFLIPAINTRAAHQTRAEVFYNREALYLNIKCYRPNANKMENQTGKDIAIQEACEIFLQPPGHKNQYQILITGAGKLNCFIEQWGVGWPIKLNPWENNGITSMIEYQPDYWQLGIRIPFTGLKQTAPQDGATWNMNICRNFNGGKELSAWSVLGEPQFQNPDYFGRAIFSVSQPVARELRITGTEAGAEFKNPTANDITVNMAMVKHTDTGVRRTASQNIIIPPGQSNSLSLPVTDAGESDSFCFLEVRNGNRLLAKHVNRPTDKFYALRIFDPEGVRGKIINIAVDYPFFMAFNFRHNEQGRSFRNTINRNEKKVDLYFEAPNGFRITGMIMDVAEWAEPVYSKASAEQLADGNTRYKLEMPMITNNPEPNYIFFYDCTMPENQEFKIQYYLDVAAAIQPRNSFTLRTMKIGKVKRVPKRFVHDSFYLNEKFLKLLFSENTFAHYTNLGMNRVTFKLRTMKNAKFYEGDAPKSMEDYADLVMSDLRRSKHKIYYCSNSNDATPKAWYFTSKDPEARAKDADGNDTPRDMMGLHSLCPTYRGKYFQEYIDNMVNSYLFKKYHCTWLVLDLELWERKTWDNLCFCNRCLEESKKFAQAKYPEFVNINPKAEFKKGNNRKFMAAWQEFKQEILYRLFDDMISPVRKSATGHASTSPLDKFTVGEWRAPSEKLLNVIDYFERGYYYTPDVVYQKMLESYQKWGDERKNNYATFTYGQTNLCPDFHMKPDQLPELIYEAAIWGMQGICWYYFHYLEPLRAKYIIAGLDAIIPFEDIILDGHITDAVSSSDKSLQVTRRELNSEGLLAVRAYGAGIDRTGTVNLGDLSGPVVVYDCASGEKVADSSSFQITVAVNRCRLFYIGTQEQWRKRTFGVEVVK